jgi:hypothetical protein
VTPEAQKLEDALRRIVDVWYASLPAIYEILVRRNTAITREVWDLLTVDEQDVVTHTTNRLNTLLQMMKMVMAELPQRES